MQFNFGCELSYRVKAPTIFIMSIEAARIPAHIGLRDSFRTDPVLDVVQTEAPPFGNRYARILAPPGTLRIRYSGEADLQPARSDPAGISEIPIADLPLELFSYLQPSRFCESDRLGNFARKTFAGLPAGFERVTAICNWICTNVEYKRGSSDALTSAAQVLEQRAGVCRDFAHLGIALTRALDIPARFASCYALGLAPDDFHAVFEAYLGGRWWLFDPTRQAALDGLVRIALGRDAAEASFASIYGDAEPEDMRVFIAAADPAAAAGDRTIDAVSTG